MPIFGRPYVKWFALCYRTVVLSCVSVMLVYWGQTVCVYKGATWYRGRPRPRPHCVRWGTQLPNFGKAPNLRARMSVFVNNLQKLKLTYYRNYCIDSNEILHSDKDHQMPFTGGPNTPITNPSWRTAAILEKSKNRHQQRFNRSPRNLAR